MTARTHDLAAITALSVAIVLTGPYQLSLATLLLAVLANQIGGIVPDVDQPTAPLWRNLPVGKYVGKVFDQLLGGHRFISHSLLGAALFSFLAYEALHFLQPILGHMDIRLVWYAFMIGLLSHLVMDTLTKEGVPWLLPVPVKFGFPPIKRFRITTGKWVENFVIFPMLLVIDVWLCFHYYPQLVNFAHQLLR